MYLKLQIHLTDLGQPSISAFTYGTGINVPMRNTINMRRVNKILRLISPTRQKFEIISNIKAPQYYRRQLQLLPLQQWRIYELLP